MKPDVEATAEQALNVAQRMALKPLIDAEKNPRRKAALEARVRALEDEAAKK